MSQTIRYSQGGEHEAKNENLPPNVIKKLARELKSLDKSPPEDIRVLVNEDNFSNIYADVEGPFGIPYEGGVFRMKLILNQDFPQTPPKGYFVTRTFHPNVVKNGEICVNSLKKDWKPTLGMRHVLLTLVGVLLLASCGVKVVGLEDSEVQEIPQSPRRMHTLFSVECNLYFDWQTVGIMHSFRKARQPGPITRLLSCTDKEAKKYKNFDIAPTHVVPSMTVHPITGDIYPAINKPAAVLHWLSHSEDAKNVDWVVILDADMIMRHPMIPWELGAQRGKPVAAYYGYLVGCESTAVLALAHTRHPELCDKVGGFLVHHIDDLRALAPLWLSKTEEVRADKEHYATKYTGDIYEQGWISEMYGYSYGAAEIGLRHKIDNDIMIYPGYTPRKGVDPLIMHYGIGFNVSSWHFAKSEHRADAILDDCNRLFPAPPYPAEVQLITTDQGKQRAHYLSIECINTINEGLLLHHAKRSCPQPPKTEYLELLLAGLDSESQSIARMSIISSEEKRGGVAITVNQQDDDVTSSSGQNKIPRHLQQNPKIHTLFSAECNDYFDWQTLGLYHSFQVSGQTGFITRLLSCTEEKLKTYKNLDLAPTHVVPSYSVHPLTGDRYTAINKPAAVYHWLSHVQMNVEYVVILDADMILRSPIIPWELGAFKGHPVAASYEYLIGCDNELAQLHTRYPEYCQKVGGVIVMHIDDLRLLAPIWLHKTEEVRADKAHWATNLTGDIYGNGWISEMYGYAFGAAELKLKHTISKNIMLYPGYIPAAGIEPRVLHYGLGFTISNWSWDKHTWHYTDMTSTCYKLFPFPPIPDRLNYSSQDEYERDLLNLECIGTLNEALILYHKRKGCKEEEDQQQQQIMLHEGPPQTDSQTAEDVLGRKVGAEFKVGMDVIGLQESKRQIVEEKLLSTRSMLSNLKPGSGSLGPKYWIMGIWGSLVMLVFLAPLASYSRRRTKRHKERIV